MCHCSHGVCNYFVGTGSSPTAVYANPLCMQMDQMLLRASSCDDVLMLSVTHRGVMFVHNLVTSLNLLSQMSSESLPFSKLKKFKFPAEYEKTVKDKMLEDPRYVLLIRDLIDYSDKLDLKSIESILSSLQKLDHCHYRLLGSILKRIYAIDLVDVSLSISIASTLQWAGFGRADMFFNKLENLLVDECLGLTSSEYLHALVIFSKLDKYHPKLYEVLAQHLPKHANSLSSKQMGIAAIAISEYGKVNSHVGGCVEILSNYLSTKMNHRDLVRGCVALRRTNFRNAKLLLYANEILMKSVETHLQRKEKIEVSSISDLAQFFESFAHFQHTTHLHTTHELLGKYLEEHVDVITEDSAIRFLYFYSIFPKLVNAETASVINLLIRKIGSTSSAIWEKHLMKICFIFFAKCVYRQFDVCDSEFRKFVIDKALAQYVTNRQGYGVVYPQESFLLYNSVLNRDSTHPIRMHTNAVSQLAFNSWIPESPFNGDVVCSNSKSVVFVFSKFDQFGNPVGTDLAQMRLVESLGWNVFPVDRNTISDETHLAKHYSTD